MFRYKADIIPTLLILAITAVDFALYFLCDNILILAIYWLALIIPKGKICAWNHHHQHTSTFRRKSLNRIMEFFYAFHTGVTTNLWLLHHVLGHHHNYMNQELDQSRWKRDSGKQMGELEYTLTVTITAYWRGYLVGKSHPKAQRAFIQYGLLTAAALIVLVVANPVSALFLFVLPMISGLLLTSWATYGHHTGLDTDNKYEASFNNVSRFYNLTTGNLGYHTAHHVKQGLHWSKLPELHDDIKHMIPDRLCKTYWI